MKLRTAAFLGLLFGITASQLLSVGCQEPCGPVNKFEAGDYLPAEGAILESDYKLTVSSDFKTVTETFTREGKAYEVHCNVSSVEEL